MQLLLTCLLLWLTYQKNGSGWGKQMELSEQLAWEMEVSRIQANKMTNVGSDTLEETLHEEQQAMMALGMARQVHQLVRSL